MLTQEPIMLKNVPILSKNAPILSKNVPHVSSVPLISEIKLEKGEKGDRGEKGEKGEKGDRGEKGEKRDKEKGEKGGDKKFDKKAAAKEILDKIRTLYLPELETLFQECVWLRTRLGSDGKNELHESERRLEQFASVIDQVIKEVQSYSMKKTIDLGSLILLEKKITVNILPVRSRLLGKLSKKNVEISINKDPVAASSAGTNALNLKHLGCHNVSSSTLGGNPSPRSPDPSLSPGLFPQYNNSPNSYTGALVEEDRVDRALVVRSSSDFSTSSSSSSTASSAYPSSYPSSFNSSSSSSYSTSPTTCPVTTTLSTCFNTSLRPTHPAHPAHGHRAPTPPYPYPSSYPSSSSIPTISISSVVSSGSDSDRSTCISPALSNNSNNNNNNNSDTDNRHTDRQDNSHNSISNSNSRDDSPRKTITSDNRTPLVPILPPHQQMGSNMGSNMGPNADHNMVQMGLNMGHNVGTMGSNVGSMGHNLVQTVSTVDFNSSHSPSSSFPSSSSYLPQYDPSFPLHELGGEIGEIGGEIGGGIGLGLGGEMASLGGEMGVLGGEIFSAEEDNDFSGFTSIWQEEEATTMVWAKLPSEGMSPVPLQPIPLPHASLSSHPSHPSHSLSHSLSNSHLSTSQPNSNYSAPNSGIPHSNSEPFLAGNHLSSSSGSAFPSSFPPMFCSVISDGVVGGEKRKYVTDERQESRMGCMNSSNPLSTSKSTSSFFPTSHPSHPSSLPSHPSHPSSYPSSSFTPAFPTTLPTSTSTPLLLSTAFVPPTSFPPTTSLPNSFPSSSSTSRLENLSEGGGTLDPIRNQEQIVQINKMNAMNAMNQLIPYPIAHPSLPSHPNHPIMSSSSGSVGGASGVSGSLSVNGPPPQGPQSPQGHGPQAPQGLQGDSDDEEAGTLGADSMGQDFISLRKRRKLNSIVPNPRKPRTADYMCAMCAETYEVTVGDNPWWAIYSQECPTCKQTQIPRIDINAPSNAIELDPNVLALYGEGVADSGDECEEGSGGEEEDAKEEDDEEAVAAAVERADREDHKRDVHPFDGEGLLGAEEASKLLVLMCHARSCVGVHASPTHSNICKSTKFLMLHIRDCSGTDVHGRNCQFPWCLSCKRMLKHLTHCYEPLSCVICAPRTLPKSFQELHKLNTSQLSASTSLADITVKTEPNVQPVQPVQTKKEKEDKTPP